MRDRLTVTPAQYRLVAYVTLGALTLIVLTGAAVRLTDSGLGCSNWPKCGGSPLPPLSTHALIEFGNRAISGVVGVLTIVAAVLAFTRKPFRRDLAWLACSLPLFVLAQAVLGGFTVREHLAPGFVMAHFALSMIALIAAVALAWRSAHEPGSRPRSSDRVSVWSIRALAPLGALTIFAGTAATAAGPHAGGSPGQRIHRLHFRGGDTLMWVIHRHATVAALFGVAVVGRVAAVPPSWCDRAHARTGDRAGDPAGRSRAGRKRPVRAAPAIRHGLGARRAGHRHVADRAVGGCRGGQAGAARCAAAGRRA